MPWPKFSLTGGFAPSRLSYRSRQWTVATLSWLANLTKHIFIFSAAYFGSLGSVAGPESMC